MKYPPHQELITATRAPRSFPTNPVDGQEHIENGILFRWDANAMGPGLGAWRRIGPVATETRYDHTESPAADVWTIPHNLGFRNVQHLVINNSGNTVIGDVDWPGSTATALRLVFDNPVQGTATIWR